MNAEFMAKAAAAAKSECSTADACDRAADRILLDRAEHLTLTEFFGLQAKWGHRVLLLDEESVLAHLSNAMENESPAQQLVCMVRDNKLVTAEPPYEHEPALPRWRSWLADHILHAALVCVVLAYLVRG